MAEKITGKGQKMNMTRVFNAPRAKVWKAWTDPKLVQKWWGPRMFTNPTCEWDVRPGGKIYVLMTGDDTPELGKYRNMKAPMRGEFKEVIEPNKLVFTGAALDEKGNPMLEDIDTVVFTDAGKDKTEMSLDILVLDVKPEMMDAMEGMGDGWSQSFDKLDELLKSI